VDFWHIGLRIGSDETRKALLLIPSQLLNQPTRDFNPRLNTVSEAGGRDFVFEADVCLIQSSLSLRRAVSFIPSCQLPCHDDWSWENKRFDCPHLHCATRSDADARDDRSAHALVLYGNRHEDGLYRAERCTYSFQCALSSMSFGSCR